MVLEYCLEFRREGWGAGWNSCPTCQQSEIQQGLQPNFKKGPEPAGLLSEDGEQQVPKCNNSTRSFIVAKFGIGPRSTNRNHVLPLPASWESPVCTTAGRAASSPAALLLLAVAKGRALHLQLLLIVFIWERKGPQLLLNSSKSLTRQKGG